jgi:hypothetical protein
LFPPYTCPDATYIWVSFVYPIARRIKPISPGSSGQRPSFLFSNAKGHKWDPFCMQEKEVYLSTTLWPYSSSGSYHYLISRERTIHIRKITLKRLGHCFCLYSAIIAFSSLVPTKSQNDRPTIPFSNRRWRALQKQE